MNEENTMPRTVSLTPKGLAMCDFAFRDGIAIGLSKEEAYNTANRLIEQWDGSETLLQIYNRTERWPEEIEPPSIQS